MKNQNNYSLSREILFVILLGFVIRFAACYNTFIVNPDTPMYIHQARAIYYGEFEKLTTCTLDFISCYPIMITGIYILFHDWILAANAISFFFGSATLIPLALLLRRFFDDQITALVTLIFAMTPVFVSQTADAMRDPMYWFFLVLGLYFFICQNDRRGYLFLLLSNLSFIIAAWARVEAVLLIIVSCFYIILIKQDKKAKKFLFFTLPTLLIILSGTLVIILYDIPLIQLARFDDIAEKFYAPYLQYRELRVELRELVNYRDHDDILRYFLPEARNCVWLIALGMLFNRTTEAFFLPFFMIFALGTLDIRKRLKEDIWISYFLLITVFGFILLYFHVLHKWILIYRFLAIIVFPCALFTGFGVEKIISFSQSIFNLKKSVIIPVLCFLIIIAALPKNLFKRAADKAIFKEIGEMIGRIEGNDREINVATSQHIQRWTSFYANLNYKGAPCPEKYENWWEDFPNDQNGFIRQLKERGIRYFIWEEKHWSPEKFDVAQMFFVPAVSPGDKGKNFKEIGRWYHVDTGWMILFELI